MDLQEFVTKTLSQISLGVTNAKMHDERIAPKIGVGGDNPKFFEHFTAQKASSWSSSTWRLLLKKEPLTEARSYRSLQRRKRQNVAPKIQRLIE